VAVNQNSGIRIQESGFSIKKRRNSRMERKKASTFQDLIVWQKAHQFVLEVYRSTRQFPKEEVSKLLDAYAKSILASGF
jgi:hypothetical protein